MRSRSSFSPLPPRSYTISTPAFSASTLSAPLKSSPSIPSTNEKISPPTLHPKQWYVPLSGDTWNDGVRSAWNGHRARKLLPARSSFTYCETTSTMESLSFICCTVSAMTLYYAHCFSKNEVIGQKQQSFRAPGSSKSEAIRNEPQSPWGAPSLSKHEMLGYKPQSPWGAPGSSKSEAIRNEPQSPWGTLPVQKVRTPEY